MANPFKMKAASGGGDFTPVPAGTHNAVLVALIDIGTYAESFQGGPPKDTRKVALVWEVDVDDTRMYVMRDYTLSFQEKASLRQLVQKWRGKEFGKEEEFDLTKLIGQPCLLSVSHKESSAGNTYARVDGAAALMKGMAPLKPVVKPIMWSVESDEPFPAAGWIPYLRGTPIQDAVKKCKELSGGKSNGTPSDEGEAVGAGAGVGTDESPF